MDQYQTKTARAHEERRQRRLALFTDVLDALKRTNRVVSIVQDPTEPRRLIGQLLNGTFLAVHVRLPAEPVTEHALAYLRRAAANHGIAFAVGDAAEVDRWLKRLCT